MNRYLTQFTALNIHNNEYEVYAGDIVFAMTQEDAVVYCKEHKPYLLVLGRIIESDPTIELN